MNTIKAIETYYKDYRFRSRLEARWAVFFDALGIQWEYEVEGYDLGGGIYYLPDFWLPKWECFAEVKPTLLTEREWNKCCALPRPCLILDSTPSHRAWAVTNAEDYRQWENDAETYASYIAGGDFGRINIPESERKGRFWFMYGEEIKYYDSPDEAIVASRSARFEHGEAPHIRQ